MQPSLLNNSWTLTNTPPLWPLEFFTVALNEKMSSLIADCEAGHFGHVWNIGGMRNVECGMRGNIQHPTPNIQRPTSKGNQGVAELRPPAGKMPRRELRVFYRDGLAVLNQQALPKLTYEQCLAEFIPASRGLKGTELQKFFCCGPDLIHDLDAARLIEMERERLAQKGPRASRLYSRESVLQFLTNRALVLDPKLN